MTATALAGQELPAASPESQGINSQVLRQMSEWVREKGYDIRSMIVLRHGRLVFEWYAGGVSRDHNHNTFSVTKSVLATLVGIAIDQGRIEGTGVRIGAFFPDAEALRGDAQKSRITVGNLLSMRSGLPSARSRKRTGSGRVLFQQIHRAPDRAQHILGLDLRHEPGETFSYGNADPQLLISILEHATHEKAMTFAERVLFRSMGFSNIEWLYPDQRGTVAGGYGLRLRAIDMAKLGQLHLQGGLWGRNRIISKGWVDKATSDRTGAGYGYLWWTGVPAGEHKSYAAKGVWGQRIQVIPVLDLVFVMTANLTSAQIRKCFPFLIIRFVLAAAASDTPLPECPDQLGLLRDELARSRCYLPPGRAGLVKSRLPHVP